jgi:hypothetical protein
MRFKDIVGKTIVGAAEMKKLQYDDQGWLKLSFSDGTDCIIWAGYGFYTGESEGEYPAILGIAKNVEDLTEA